MDGISRTKTGLRVKQLHSKDDSSSEVISEELSDVNSAHYDENYDSSKTP